MPRILRPSVKFFQLKDGAISLRVVWKGQSDLRIRFAVPNFNLSMVRNLKWSPAQQRFISRNSLANQFNEELDGLAVHLEETIDAMLEQKIELSPKKIISYAYRDFLDEIGGDWRETVQELATLKGLSQNTVRNYITVGNKFADIVALDVDYMSVQDMNDRLLIYRNYLANAVDEGKLSSNTARINFSIITNIIKQKNNESPLKNCQLNKVKLGKKYKVVENHRGVLNERQFNALKDWYIANMDGFTPTRKLTWQSAAYWFFVGFNLQGLAFVDLVKLKKSQFILLTNECGEQYYKVSNLKRSKTNVAVNMSIEIDSWFEKIFKFCFDTADERGGYLFDFWGINDKVMTLKTISPSLSHAFKTFITRYNVQVEEEELKLPSDLSYYSARHTFCSLLANKTNNLVLISNLMGRSVNTIATYVKSLNSDEDVLSVKKLI